MTRTNNTNAMKKNLFFASLALASLVSFSCTKEFGDIQRGKAATTNTISLTVNNEPWFAEKSSYTPGTGIALDGDEKIGVFYYRPDGEKPGYYGPTNPAGNSRFGIATPTSSNGIYSFEADEGTTSYRWYGLVPYSFAIYGITSNRAAFTTRIGPVQFPGQNTFDPMQDILVSRSFGIVDNSATINSFKRLTAPLRIRVRGLGESEKIYAATLSVGQAFSTSSCLVACMNTVVSNTDDGTESTAGSAYDGAHFSIANGNNYSNTVSAVYQSGLSPIDDPTSSGKCWPVWLSVCPMTISSGSTITLTVTTGSATYSRTVDVVSDMELYSEKINDIGLGFSEKRKTVESISQDFLGVTDSSNGTKYLKASDGNQYAWTFNGIVMATSSTDRESDLRLCPIMKETSTLTIPDFGPLCRIKKVKVFTHVASNATGNSQKMAFYDGETMVGNEIRVNLNRSATGTLDGLYLTGGVAEFTCPEERSSLGGLTLKTSSGSGNVFLSRITFEIERITSYKALYDAGEDIEIGDITVNNIDYPNAAVLKPSEITNLSALNSLISANDVIFITDEENGTAGTFFPASMLNFPAKAVIIGDNPRQQPIFANEENVFRPSKSLYLKNIHVTCTHESSVSVSNQLTEDATLAFEDCFMEINGGITDDNPAYNFSRLYLKNNVFVIGGDNRMVYLQDIKKTKPSEGGTSIKLYEISNNVFAYKNVTKYNLVYTRLNYAGTTGSTGYISTPDLEFKFCQNTVYNDAAIACLLNDPKSLQCNGNVFESDFSIATAGTIRMFWTTTHPEGYTGQINNNYLNYFRKRSGTNGKNNVSILSNTDATSTPTGNNIVRHETGLSGNSVFESVDLSKGYLPVDRNVVTNGAGADYTTKYWMN